MTWVLRKLLGSLGPAETMELLLDRLAHTENNQELQNLILNSSFAENVLSKRGQIKPTRLAVHSGPVVFHVYPVTADRAV